MPQVTTYCKAIKVTVDGPREPRSKTNTPQMRPPPLHRFLEQPAFNHHHHYPGRPSSFGGGGGPGGGNNGPLGSNGIGGGPAPGSGGNIGVGAGSGGTGLGSGNGKSSSVSYSNNGTSSTGSTSLHSHHHHHHHHHQGGSGPGGNGAGTGGNMTINTSAESSSDYKPNLALSDYSNAPDWTNGLGAPSSTSYMNTFSPLQASPPSYVAYESCPMVDHPNYSLTASGDNIQPYQDYYGLAGPPPPPPVAPVVAPSVNSQSQLGAQLATGGSSYVAKAGELVEASTYPTYPHHTQWTNGYHGSYHHHQYNHPSVAAAPGCASSLAAVATQPPASFHTPTAPPPPPPPPMVLCPQMFSTVNQNQIHVHLHGSGSEKFEHYFGAADNGFTINSFPGPSIRSVPAPVTSSLSGSSVDIGGIGAHHHPDSGPVAGNDSLTALLSAHHAEEGHPQHSGGGQEQQQQDEARGEDTGVSGDPSSVWRPY
uniref:Runt domain-containing protein n=1 Tax=Anopheles maculatus TaxID=74869 RepID=A0A182SQW9_9DIPT